MKRRLKPPPYTDEATVRRLLERNGQLEINLQPGHAAWGPTRVVVGPARLTYQRLTGKGIHLNIERPPSKQE